MIKTCDDLKNFLRKNGVLNLESLNRIDQGELDQYSPIFGCIYENCLRLNGSGELIGGGIIRYAHKPNLLNQENFDKLMGCYNKDYTKFLGRETSFTETMERLKKESNLYKAMESLGHILDQTVFDAFCDIYTAKEITQESFERQQKLGHRTHDVIYNFPESVQNCYASLANIDNTLLTKENLQRLNDRIKASKTGTQVTVELWDFLIELILDYNTLRYID